MKHTTLILLLAASTMAASAQTPAKPATPAAKPATTVVKPATTVVKPATTAAKPATSAAKLPLGVPAPGIPAVKTIKKPLFTAVLHYQEIKVGAGAVAEPNKMYKIHYTGWLGNNGRADDGTKFDSSYDRPGPPLKDKDGKPVMGDDGKPKLDDPQPAPFPQGAGVFITGFDQGFAGMKIGGKRRLFIPWQLGYGTRTIPEHGPGHPGIPPKSDLIFDVELVDVTDMPAPQSRPGMMPGGHPTPGMRPMPGGMAPKPGTPGTPAAPGAPAAPPAPGVAPTPAAPAAPSTPAAPNAAPAPAAAPTPAAPAPAAPATPAPPQPK